MAVHSKFKTDERIIRNGEKPIYFFAVTRFTRADYPVGRQRQHFL
jgi:hypothetical protein